MNIHDSGYKKLFANQTIFRQLLETFVNQEWVNQLDFSTCETLDKSFISQHYQETESDLIYKVQLLNHEVYIYILIEFQSTVDPFMALRVLNYITNFYMDYIANHKQVKKLPAVFPIVLYNGEDRWTAPTNLSDLIEQAPSLGAFTLAFRYFLIAENQYSQQALLKIRNIVSTLFLAESHYDVDVLETELLNLFSSEADKGAVSLFLNWFKQLALHGRIASEDYESLETIYRNEEEVRTMLITALEKEKQQIYHNGHIEGKREGHVEGKREGRVEGKREGRVEGKIETARAMLAKGMEIKLIAEITELSQAQLLQLKAELSSEKG